jgi:peptidoglycan/LPS O-acetylase OafA/YrhL
MAIHSSHKAPKYRPDIDGLRAVAVLPVVFYHAGLPGFSGGFVGVDIFFVISGFLITGIVWSEMRTGTFSLQNFYIRRVKRIFPALFTVLFFCSIAAYFLLIPDDLVAFGKSVSATVLFFSNLYLVKQANYFAAPAADNPLLHTWSLSVEEQFYAVWPLVLLVLGHTVSTRRIPYIIVALALISLIFAEARMPNYQKDAFYLPWCRGWELFLGAALAVSPAIFRPGLFATGFGCAGLAGIALAVSFYDSSTRFPGLTALLPCLGAALIIATGERANPVSRILSIEPLRRIGLISYSLYLIHWPLLSFAHLYLNEELSLTQRLLIVSISFLLAFLSWRFIETPCRTARLPSWQVFGAAAAATGCLYLAGLVFYSANGFPSRVNETVLQTVALSMERHDSKYCRDIVIPEAAGGAIACEFGENAGGSYDFILWGDSHAHHFTPAIGALAKARGLSGVLLHKAACHPFLDDPSTSKDCRKFNSAIARWINDHPIKLAILGGRWGSHRKDFKWFIGQRNPKENKGGLAKTLAFLNSRGIAVSVLDQVPEFPQPVNLCVARARYYNRGIKPCVTMPVERFRSSHRDLDRYFAFLKTEYSFSVASVAGALCDGEECRAMDGSTFIMMDANHLTEAGALHLAPYLKIPFLSPPGAENAAVAVSAPLPAKPGPPL